MNEARLKMAYEQSLKRMSYEEFKACYCPECQKKDCPHRDNFRRLPISTGGLGLCPNLKI